MKLSAGLIIAFTLSAAPSFAASYTLQITNNTNRHILKVWVKPGDIDSTSCVDKDVCERQVIVQDGICKSDVTVNMLNGGRAKSSVYWCSGESVVKVELRR